MDAMEAVTVKPARDVKAYARRYYALNKQRMQETAKIRYNKLISGQTPSVGAKLATKKGEIDFEPAKRPRGRPRKILFEVDGALKSPVDKNDLIFEDLGNL